VNDLIDLNIRLMDDAEARLLGSIEEVEAEIWNRVREILFQFKTKDGYFVPDEMNATLVNSLKRELRTILKSTSFPSKVDDFLASFDEIGENVQAIHQDLNGIRVPQNLVNRQKLIAISNTMDNLLESNVSARFVDPIKRSLFNHVNFGSGVLDAEADLRRTIISQGGDAGVLRRWVGQVARDSIQQYEGGINRKVAEEFGLTNWIYVGATGGVTRKQCARWMRIGTIEGKNLQAEISWAQKNGSGMIPGTTPENFPVNRGGYNCRHSAYPTRAKEEDPKAKPPVKRKTPAKKKEAAPTVDQDRAKSMIPKINQKAINPSLPLRFWNLFKEPVKYKTNNSQGSALVEYRGRPDLNYVQINTKRHSQGTENSIFAHEYGHALHQQHKVFGNSSYGQGEPWPEFEAAFAKSKKDIGLGDLDEIPEAAANILANIFQEIEEDYTFEFMGNQITRKRRINPTRKRIAEENGLKYGSSLEAEHWGAFADTIEALTASRYGYGHGSEYFRDPKASFFGGSMTNGERMQRAEYFAHAFENRWYEANPYTKALFPELQETMVAWADEFERLVYLKRVEE